MRNIFFLLATVFCIQSACAQNGSKQITIDDLYKDYTFRVKDVPGFNAMKDGTHFTKLDEEGTRQFIRVYDLESGDQLKTLFDNEACGLSAKVESYEFSKDEQKMLLFCEGQNIYRNSILHKVYIYDIATHKATLVDNDKILHATFSPDGSKIAFVKNNNLYYKDLETGSLIQITTDGEKNRIINGNCDWVYEEEFSFSRAYEWSKNGSYLAYYRFDESNVPEYTLAKYSGLYPEQYTYKYPKAGERNSAIEIKIYDLNKRKTVNAAIGPVEDQYIPRITWTENNKN